MSALQQDLAGLGMPWPLAQVVGMNIVSKTGVGTSQGGSSPTVVSGDVALITTAAGQTAVTFTANLPVGATIYAFNTGASIYQAAIFPASGESISPLSANTAYSLSAGSGVQFIKMTTTAWRALPAPLPVNIVSSQTAVGTAQGGSSPTLYARTVSLLTTAASQTAITIDASFPIGMTAECYCITATTGLLFPPSGCTIDQGSANASVNIAQNKGRIVRRTSATTFHTILSA